MHASKIGPIATVGETCSERTLLKIGLNIYMYLNMNIFAREFAQAQIKRNIECRISH